MQNRKLNLNIRDRSFYTSKTKFLYACPPHVINKKLQRTKQSLTLFNVAKLLVNNTEIREGRIHKPYRIREFRK